MDNVTAFRARIGSANYNLQLPMSDEDYVIVRYPTFNDLYGKQDASKKSETSDRVDRSYMDVRQLRDGLIKSNPNTIEILYSNRVTDVQSNLWGELQEFRQEITVMNLSHLFDASFGMFHNEMKRYQREMQKGDKVRAGKAAASGFRIMLTIYDFYKKDFTDYVGCMRYDNEVDKNAREKLINMKLGIVKPEFIKEQAGQYYALSEELKPKFHAHFKNEALEKEVREIFHFYTKQQLQKELLAGGLI
ncbi:nucleotidyltransferase [Phage f2b1]|nr:nucleotidyltransferase [Phage f2b1]